MTMATNNQPQKTISAFSEEVFNGVETKFVFPTETERQNQLDDMMDWRRGWREDCFNAQTTEERFNYLCNPDSADVDEIEKCLFLLNDWVAYNPDEVQKARERLFNKILILELVNK